MPVNHSSRTIAPIVPRATTSSKARWIDPLTDPRPLWQFYQQHQSVVVALTSFIKCPENAAPTVNPLAITLLLAIKHGIFILRSHLRLRWHLLFPPLQLRRRLHIVLLEGIVDSRDYIVDKAKAFPLTALLGGGEAPGYLPMRGDC